jgi:beta-glucosidase-like glycosyl hydrolase
MNNTSRTIASRCIFGYTNQVHTEGSPAWTLLQHAPLGYIFFRDAFRGCESLQDIGELTQRLIISYPSKNYCPILSLDQEGGQVERLPSWLFPGMLSPHAVGDVARHEDSRDFATRHYDFMAKGLASLGFNLNFFPTMDAHLNPDNPIIGNRAFSHDPEHVARMGYEAMGSQHAHGIQSVLKHYPGHGNGVVDSHLALPELIYTPEEERAFSDTCLLPTNGRLPWIMVAHGAYPALQAKKHYPASCDHDVVTKRLRDQLGFKGITITDDLDMRGVMDAFDDNLLEACIAAMNAGVDVLLFRGSGERELELFEALCQAYEDGRINEAFHQESIARIHTHRQEYLKKSEHIPVGAGLVPTRQALLDTEAMALHTEAMAVLLKQLGVNPFKSIHLIQPQEGCLPHYDMERQHGERFEDNLQTAFPDKQISLSFYDEQWDHPPMSDNDLNILIVWLPKVGKPLMNKIANTSNGRVLIVNIGAPVDGSGLHEQVTLLNLSGWRPLQQRAFVDAFKYIRHLS